jgi:MFS family permease
MSEGKGKVTNYRWVILALYFFITLIIEVQWLTFASISTIAQQYYNASSLEIDFFSMIYMIVFIVLSIPASYIIDTHGLRKGLYIGAVLTGGFSLMKAFFADNYMAVAIAQTGLAAAQPFILNAVTKVGATWFPRNERATVAGIGSLAQYAGIIIALAVTPLLLVETGEGVYELSSMLMTYGFISAAGALLLLIFFRKQPAPSVDKIASCERINPIEGMRHIFSSTDMKLLLLMFFFGLGIFNAVSTCIDQICGALSMEETGIVGGVMLFGGILGAIIIPILSDRLRKRKPFLVLCMGLMLPGLLGLTFFTTFMALAISAFVFGFFIMSAGPVGFQYGAEKSYPAPESTSQGLILLVGQISGIVFVVGVNAIGILPAMLFFIGLVTVNVFLTLRISESYAPAQ